MLVVGLTIVGLLCVLFVASRSMLLQRFVEVDRRAAAESCRRVDGLIRFTDAQMDQACKDWAWWDDLYAYTETRDPDFEKANLSNASFENLRLSARAVFGVNGQPMWLDGWDVPSGLPRMFPEGLDAFLQDHPEVFAIVTRTGSVTGVVRMPEGLISVALREIRDSEGEGVSRGFFLWGRAFDADRMQQLRRLAGQEVDLFAVTGGPVPADVSRAIDAWRGSNDWSEIMTDELDPSVVAGYVAIPDVLGRPAGVLRVTSARAAYAQGTRAVQHLSVALTLAAGASVLATVLLLGPVVLTRLERLSRELRLVAAGRASHVTVTGEDELSHVAGAVNTSLDAMNAALRRVEEASRVKGEFLANVSHEIRTPMTAIIGYADLLADPQLSEDQRRDAAGVIRRNGEHLLAIISDILDLSKVEAGRMTVEQIPCDPTRLLCDVVSLLRARAAEKGLALRFEPRGELPPVILTDPTRFKQILINLVGNAIKFTNSGEVRVAASIAGVRAIAIDVIDSGIGIAPERLDTLFQPFCQGDGSMTRRFGGTGLGLAISQRLAGLLGGEIRVQSVQGVGSTFTLRVDTGEPTALGAMVAAECRSRMEEAASTGTARGVRVLLAEDGIENQRLISLLLERAGASVVCVSHGAEAVEAVAAAAKPFDLILTDMQMPVMDGYQAARAIRAAGYTGSIVALTANVSSDERARALAAGCDDFATKPIDRARLVELVTRWTACPARTAA